MLPLHAKFLITRLWLREPTLGQRWRLVHEPFILVIFVFEIIFVSILEYLGENLFIVNSNRMLQIGDRFETALMNDVKLG